MKYPESLPLLASIPTTDSMKNAAQLFHSISYLQYPLMLIGIYYCYKPLLFNADSIWADYNKALVFIGLAISFSTLQDTKKTQNKLSKRVWENPKYARAFLIYIALLIVFIISFGMFGLFGTENANVQELSFGAIIFGIGLIGLLKTAIEMAENHRPKSDL